MYDNAVATFPLSLKALPHFAKFRNHTVFNINAIYQTHHDVTESVHIRVSESTSELTGRTET